MTRAKEFERLAAVAKLVLVLPHANADAERVFSVVGLNKPREETAYHGWQPVINNDHKDGQSGALLQMGAPPQISSRPPRRPQASITMPTDHRQGLYPASDLHLILIMPHFLLFCNAFICFIA